MYKIGNLLSRITNPKMDFGDNKMTIQRAIQNKELPRYIYKYFTNAMVRYKLK